MFVYLRSLERNQFIVITYLITCGLIKTFNKIDNVNLFPAIY